MKYPYHISEYAHSMGNACGNLIDYWEAIESTNFFIGGAIWDWVDRAMYGYDNGNRYFGYGGDFRWDNKPNDGMFCMNGVMRPDLSPKAQYYEVKKVYQNVGVKAVDMKKGLVEIFNKNYFEPLTQYNIQWGLYKDGVLVGSMQPLQGPRNIVGPREKQVYTLPYNYNELDPASEYFVKVVFALASDKPWAKQGYVQMEEQLRVRGALEKAPAVQTLTAESKGKVTTTNEGNFTVVKGEGFTAKFDKQTGSLAALTYGAQTIIREGEGPKLDAFRAPTDNDAGIGYPNAWFQYGLYNLHHKVTGAKTITKKDGTVQLSFTVESRAQRVHANTTAIATVRPKRRTASTSTRRNSVPTTSSSPRTRFTPFIPTVRSNCKVPFRPTALLWYCRASVMPCSCPVNSTTTTTTAAAPSTTTTTAKRASSSNFTLRP